MDTDSTFRRPFGMHSAASQAPIFHHFAERAPAISIEEALERTLVEYFCWHRKRTVIATWELAAAFVTMVRCWNWDMYKLWQGNLLELNYREFRKFRERLLEADLLYRIDGANGMFLAFHPYVEPREFISQIDPFGCFAFGTAMHIHKLADWDAPFIYTKSPPRPVWRELAMKESERHGLPWKDMPMMREVSPWRLSGFQWVRVRDARLDCGWTDYNESVTSRAETFIDMTREPSKCGGWSVVLEAFRRCDRSDVDSIISRLDRDGTLADKARMGFLLERLGIVERAPDDWVDALQRGGSMRLDAARTYSSNLSDRWKLSLNVPEQHFKG